MRATARPRSTTRLRVCARTQACACACACASSCRHDAVQQRSDRADARRTTEGGACALQADAQARRLCAEASAGAVRC
eukprot:2907753-Pleurochrysis_carterae.AAC.1